MHKCLHHHHDNRHPLFCIIPSYMLENIVKRGDPEQQELARQTLISAAQFRAGRQQIAALTVASPQEAAAVAKKRTIYDAQNGTTLPGPKVVRREGQGPTGDAAVDEAYDGSGATFDLYYDIYGRNSIDNNGMGLISTVHYGQKYNNAFWNGQQMTYGDGDGSIFNRFTIAIDVIGHELTHGVVQHTANLVYQNQPGALNESMADVFGSLVKQRKLGQTAAQADWLIGAGLLTAKVKGQALRSMKAPGTAYDDPVLGKDPQPAHMKDIYTGSADNGGVHINSGIPNHAFYNAALEIGGNAWEKAGRIWYVTLKDKLGRNSDFQDAANKTYQVAGDLYGANSLEQKAVVKGWADVGINITVSTGQWYYNRLVQYTYTAYPSKYAFAVIEGVSGWKQIYPSTPDGVTNLFKLLCLAKGTNRRVQVYIQNISGVDYITNAYLL